MTATKTPPLHPDAAFFSTAFAIRRPETQTLPLVFDSPHSGRRYPPSLLARSRLDALSLRRSEDCFVDRLFAGIVARGAPLLNAHFPRAYVDANREPYELDPEMFEDPLPPYSNICSERVAAGLGTIARVVADGSEIYADKLSFQDADWRIQALHQHYHAALEGLISATQRIFGAALLIDCHSMPSNMGSNAGVLGRADIVLGDRFGASCAGLIVTEAESFLRSRGYRVIRNIPYAGGYICAHYGRPMLGRHALQIEVNRALYMDESRFAPHSGFARVAADMAALAPVLSAALSRVPAAEAHPLAAE